MLWLSLAACAPVPNSDSAAGRAPSDHDSGLSGDGACTGQPDQATFYANCTVEARSPSDTPNASDVVETTGYDDLARIVVEHGEYGTYTTHRVHSFDTTGCEVVEEGALDQGSSTYQSTTLRECDDHVNLTREATTTQSESASTESDYGYANTYEGDLLVHVLFTGEFDGEAVDPIVTTYAYDTDGRVVEERMDAATFGCNEQLTTWNCGLRERVTVGDCGQDPYVTYAYEHDREGRLMAIEATTDWSTAAVGYLYTDEDMLPDAKSETGDSGRTQTTVTYTNTCP